MLIDKHEFGENENDYGETAEEKKKRNKKRRNRAERSDIIKI